MDDQAICCKIQQIFTRFSQDPKTTLLYNYDMANKIIQQIIKQRGVLFNLFFLLYMLSLQPILLREVSWVIERGRLNPILGWLMVIVSVLETIGIFLKTPAVAKRLDLAKRVGEAEKAGTGFVFLVWIFHTVIAVCLLMLAFQAFGVWSTGSEDEISLTAALIMFGLITKEIVILLYWMIKFAPEPEDQRKESTAEQWRKMTRREIAGDIALFIFAAVAFTSIWEYIAINTPIETGNIFYMLLQYALAGFLCLLFYLPIRSLYIFEEFLMRSSRRDDLLFWGTVSINVIVCLTIIPFK